MDIVEDPKGEGFRFYYITKIEKLQLIVAEKSQNLRRLQGQRHEFNAKVRMLREEQESYVDEVIKPMDEKKVLVRVHPERKFVVDINKNIDNIDVTPNCRVASRNESYTLHKILRNKVDLLVSLMMVKKVPDSTYEMHGGLDKQIKEVIELHVKHPELFDSLGIAQLKGPTVLYSHYYDGFQEKTLLAHAVAHHTECTFIRVSGSKLIKNFIGEGSRMVGELFLMARKQQFMDEIDSIGSSRIESCSGGDSEVQRTMLELLKQLDGVEATKYTNRIDILELALLRPDRINRKIEFSPPNKKARLNILKIHSRKVNLTRRIRERRVHVTQKDIEMVVVKVMQKNSVKNMKIDATSSPYSLGHNSENNHDHEKNDSDFVPEEIGLEESELEDIIEQIEEQNTSSEIIAETETWKGRPKKEE
ncbi:26S proteasome regulatory subunit 8-like [Anthonomus grandis grandis]|uniref:26S proteasome regulatory subunit 8-like n=1 Tax=Anthonomus grandis grandis TaxID=2921223 RepID=UPI002166AE9C|nr:26S proteasome regulatory subunit 8-like [Anthonomus grandis grandis]